ncbi:MAG: hypothetical protein E7568_04635 [Ruminococcaceae bacterium]|nr:hypothetical protein [Oscillospiraceae bacterium]
MFKRGAKLFFKFAIGILMCLFVYFSFIFAFNAAFSDVTGYNIYHHNSETSREEIVCIHNAEDTNPDGCKCSEYDGEKLNKINITALSKEKENIAIALAQFFSIVLITAVIYGSVWEMGNKDFSAVRLGKISSSKSKGVAIGAIAATPSIVIYLLLVLSWAKILNPHFLNTFRLLNSHFHGYLTFIYSSAKIATDLTIAQILLCAVPAIYLVLVSAVAYLLGFKDIKLFEKAIYKKKK